MNTTADRKLQSTPDGLPLLARGSHRTPEQGTCLMEYVSVLAGLPFADRPGCTHPLLTWLAQRVNDGVSDAARPRLVTVAPDLIGTRVRKPWVRVAVFSELARAGLVGRPADRWLTELAARAEAHLSRPPCRAWPRPLTTFDRGFTFSRVQAALCDLAPGERDELWLAMLTGAIRRARGELDLADFPTTEPASVSATDRACP